MRRFATKSIAALLSLTLSSCLVTYRRFPAAKVGAPAPSKAYAKLYYSVEGSALAGGQDALADAIRGKSPFNEVEVSEEAPPQGLFVKAKTSTISPSVPSIIFGYISWATLTLTPAWTTNSGSDVIFEVYVDGKKNRTFDYHVRRKGFVWVVLLPFIWANLFTYSEEQAFDAITLQFFDDADSLFRTASTPAP
jgi:hypothetical protein